MSAAELYLAQGTPSATPPRMTVAQQLEEYRRRRAAAEGSTYPPAGGMTVAEQLEAYRASKRGKTVAQQLEEYRQERTARDRAFEWESQRPPALDEMTRTLPEAPPGYFERNPRGEPAPTQADELLRALQIGTQAVGRGAADLAGLPGDLAEILLDAGAAGLRLAGADIPDGIDGSGRWVAGGDQIADLFATGTEAALGDVLIDKADMTPDERLRYEAARFGTQGAAGGVILSRASNVAPRGMTAPYTAPGSVGRVVAGDTAAGVGSGVAMQQHEEMGTPLGPIGDFVIGLLGGVGGAAALRGVEATADAAQGGVNAYRTMPEGVVPADPTTGLPVSRRDFANAAQMNRNAYRSQGAFDQARDEITAYLDEFGAEGPNPSVALITNDPAQLAAERRARAADNVPFIETDRAVSDRATALVQGTRPEGADPALPGRVATTVAANRRAESIKAAEDAEAAFQDAQRQQAELATILQTGPSPGRASTELDRLLIDEVFFPRLDAKNNAFREAGADPNVVVRSDNARAAAEAEAANISARPSLRDPRVTAIVDDFRGTPDGASAGETLPVRQGKAPLPDAPPTVYPLSEIMNQRAALSEIEREARLSQHQRLADTARSIRTGVTKDIKAAATSGAPGTERLAAADQFYSNEFAPYFRQAATGDFFRDLAWDRARERLLPENTARRFLNDSDMQRATAQDLARILKIAPDRPAAVKAATDYAVADAVASGIVRNGVVDELALSRWVARREGMLSALPEVRGRFDELLAAVRRGNGDANRLSQELRLARENATMTERDIQRGALALAIDTTPDRMVRGILADRNPAARMRELIAGFDNNVDAVAGLRAAVTDYLVRKSKSASTAGSASGQEALLQSKAARLFEENREALAEVYGPEEMSALEQANRLLDILSRKGVQATGGSGTAENVGGLRGIIAAFAEPVGFATTIARGALYGGSYERRTRLIAEQFPDANEAAVAILDRARFDPELTLHLMNFPTTDAQVYTWSQKLNRLLNLGAVEDEGE